MGTYVINIYLQNTPVNCIYIHIILMQGMVVVSKQDPNLAVAALAIGCNHHILFLCDKMPVEWRARSYSMTLDMGLLRRE